MMQIRDIALLFLNHTPIPGVLFKHNDYIRVVDGRYAGQAESLVTIIRLDPEPRFVVELEPRADMEIMQCKLNMPIPNLSLKRNGVKMRRLIAPR